MSVVLSDAEAHKALLSASKAGATWLVRRLIDGGVDPNYHFGAALLLADFYGNTETASLLRDAGCKHPAEWPAPPSSGPKPH